MSVDNSGQDQVASREITTIDERDEAAVKESLRFMATEVLAWWEKHQYDIVEYPEDDLPDAYIEQANVYDQPPNFVKEAIVLMGQDLYKETPQGRLDSF